MRRSQLSGYILLTDLIFLYHVTSQTPSNSALTSYPSTPSTATNITWIHITTLNPHDRPPQCTNCTFTDYEDTSRSEYQQRKHRKRRRNRKPTNRNERRRPKSNPHKKHSTRVRLDRPAQFLSAPDPSDNIIPDTDFTTKSTTSTPSTTKISSPVRYLLPPLVEQFFISNDMTSEPIHKKTESSVNPRGSTKFKNTIYYKENEIDSYFTTSSVAKMEQALIKSDKPEFKPIVVQPTPPYRPTVTTQSSNINENENPHRSKFISNEVANAGMQVVSMHTPAYVQPFTENHRYTAQPNEKYQARIPDASQNQNQDYKNERPPSTQPQYKLTQSYQSSQDRVLENEIKSIQSYHNHNSERSQSHNQKTDKTQNFQQFQEGPLMQSPFNIHNQDIQRLSHYQQQPQNQETEISTRDKNQNFHNYQEKPSSTQSPQEIQGSANHQQQQPRNQETENPPTEKTLNSEQPQERPPPVQSLSNPHNQEIKATSHDKQQPLQEQTHNFQQYQEWLQSQERPPFIPRTYELDNRDHRTSQGQQTHPATPNQSQPQLIRPNDYNELIPPENYQTQPSPILSLEDYKRQALENYKTSDVSNKYRSTTTTLQKMWQQEVRPTTPVYNNSTTASQQHSSGKGLELAESQYFPDLPTEQEVSSLFQNDNQVIPGTAGKDYPTFGQSLLQKRRRFACRGLEGYFADVSTRCQVFYICNGNGAGEPMLCPNGTLFSQELLVCDWWYNVDC